MDITESEGILKKENSFSNKALPKDICKCTIYDCEFDSYHEGVMCSNKILVIQDNESLVPAKKGVYQSRGRVSNPIGI